MSDWTVTVLFSAYTTFALCCGWIYGRHKGLSKWRAEAILEAKDSARFRFIELSSQIWFIATTFIIPWYLCIVWLFYAGLFGGSQHDLHYLNDFNPWVLPIVVIYALHSLAIMASYSLYSHFDLFSKRAFRVTVVLGVLLTVCVLFVLVKNEGNDPETFSSDGFYGHQILHCFDFDVHQNPLLLSILLILYCSVTHHLFVTLRVTAAKCCDHDYIEKTVEFYSKRKRKRLKKLRKQRTESKRKSKRKASYNPDDGTVYEYDSSTLDDCDFEMSESVGINRRRPGNDYFYRKNPSDSRSQKQCKKNGPRPVYADELELRLEHVMSAEVESKNPRPQSVYV